MTRDFRILATGQGLSWLGNGFQTVALAFAVVNTGGGPGELGLVMASELIAMLAGTLFGGVWADRLQPQRMMVLSDAVRCGAVAGMAAIFGLDQRSVPLLCGLAALFGGAGSFFTPALAALKPMIVPAEQLRSANATLSLLQTSCSVLGPVAGGLVVAAFGAPVGFVVNAASFLVSIATALLIRARVERSARSGMLRELAEGWSEVRSRPWLLSGVISAAIYLLANGVVLVLATVIAIRDLGGAHAVGLIAAAQGIGSVIGAGAAIRLRPQRFLRTGWLVLLLMPLWVLAYVWPAELVAVMAGAVVGYAGLSFFSVAWQTTIQQNVPHRVLARVTSWDMLTSFLAMPLGSAVAGPLAAAFGFDHVLIVCAFILFTSTLMPLFIPGIPELAQLAPQAEVPTTEVA